MNTVGFYRLDYAQVGKTNRGCLKVIKNDNSIDRDSRKKKKNNPCDKIVVGADCGVLLCLERVNHDTSIIFKTNPDQPITKVCVGGALNTVLDKTFAACGPFIKGYSKKGKQFLSFDTDLTESICGLYIYGVDMILSSQFAVYHFHDCVERSCYICPERVTDVICLPVTEGGWVGRGITPVAASEDKTIKVLDNGKVVYSLEINDVAITLRLFLSDGGFDHKKVIYGTKSGKLGLADLQNDSGSIVWEMETKSNGMINAITFHRITGEGLCDLVLGKDDGLIEMYNIDENEKLHYIMQYQCDESITGLDCGHVNTRRIEEIVACTFTGWVFGLATEQYEEHDNKLSDEKMSIKVQQLKSEIDQLEQKVTDEREKYETMISTNPNDMTMVNSVNIVDKFVLDKETSCYILTLELVVPISYVVIQCDTDIELVDISRNTAVISFTNPHQDDSTTKLLATYRCQANTTRIEMRIRSFEGRYGVFNVYIVPDIRPKMCQWRKYHIKALALHERVHEFDPQRPLNVLTVTGDFTLSDAHEWLLSCVTQIPESGATDTEVSYMFRSTENGGTVLQAKYKNGKAIFKSDSVSSIVIIRDVINKMTTDSKIKVQLSIATSDESIEHVLRLVDPKLQHLTELKKKSILAKGAKELEASFEDHSFIEEDLLELIKKCEELNKEFDKKKTQLSRLMGFVTDLYIDKYKLKGIGVKNKVDELVTILEDDYSFEKVYQFFNEIPT